jgi:hypothetical protein
MGAKNIIIFIFISLIYLSGCQKFQWNNPYDPECPKELFTPSSPGATMEGNSVKLIWSQQNDNISGFALFRSAEGESITNLTQTQKSTTQYIDASITPGKKYTYYVVAVAGTNKSDTVKAEIIPIIPVSISTGAVIELAATSAKVSGNITNAGGGTVTSRGICWSTTPSPTVNSSKTTEGTGTGQFTSSLTNLLAGTTYYARAYGENSRGISYGSEVTFTTLGPPKLTTTAVSNITATTATSGGTIISDGGSPITAKGVVWSTSPNPTILLATKTDDGTGLGSFTSTMSNLTNNTKYYFRAYATNFVGTTYGEEFSFTAGFPVLPILESIKQGLVAYYPFNGNANDESGNGNHGTVNGATLTQDRFGNVGKAYSFDGVDDYINTTLNTVKNSNSRTVYFWVKTPGIISNLQEIIIDEGGKECGTGFAICNTPSNLIKVDNTCSFKKNEETIKLNQWISVVIVFDNSIASDFSAIRFIIDGIEYNNSSITGSNININSGIDYPLIFGKSRIPTDGYNFFGSLDDIRIYNRALSQDEITYLANN